MVDQEALRKQMRAAYDLHSSTLATVRGADTLIALYGDAPSFHDAEVLAIELRAEGISAVRVAAPYPDIFGSDRVIVTFEIAQVLDVDLDFFGAQNILFSLQVRPAVDRPDRRGHIDRLVAGDLEIELEASVGVGGIIVCRGVSVGWTKDSGPAAAARL